MTARNLIYSPGKIGYNREGNKNCKVTFEVSYDGDRFSMEATIWNPSGTDCHACGQIVDQAAGYFPNDAKTQEMVRVWRDWHLNDMCAGSPAQTAFLKTYTGKRDYPAALTALQDAGLSPDETFHHNGKPYVYGSAWLKRELPADVKATIEAWFK